jgi:pimeloyl-ACP methyl ester carboxylesterase
MPARYPDRARLIRPWPDPAIRALWPQRAKSTGRPRSTILAMTPSSPITLDEGRAIAGASGTPVWVEQRGSGEPVLLLGGLSDAHDVWGYQFEGELAAGHRLIAPDNRGVGRTPIPADGISVTAMADDAAEVLRALGTFPAHVAGFSMGGAIGQALAIRHPELVRSLVLVNTTSHFDGREQRLLETWIALAEHAPEEVFFELLLRWVYSDAAHEDGRVAAWMAAASEHPYPPSTEALVAQMRACLEHDARAGLARLDVPTLLVCGAADPIFPPEHQRELAARIPGARIAWMPGLAHQPFHEDPAAFDAIVAGFWREIEDAGA